ncbi:uncharacterized protein LOC121966608, partial [Plectropomus leopardus]|uniref:uncharacterized protein LOC121966608 n=1 Tax=Plectropomus leopardus TaxID=160734 RepID=UPI001C4AD7D8
MWNNNQKMIVLFYLLLMLRVGRCAEDQIFETKTVGVGADVRLTCSRKLSGRIFWIRLVSGGFPKILGKTYSIDSDSRITATEEPGIFALHIKDVKLSDTAVYLCMKIHKQNFTFLKGTDLRVEEPEPEVTAVPPSDPACPEDSVTLQCSVLSDSENKTRPGEHNVHCFRAGSHQCHPSFDCTQENSVEEHKKNPEACFYSFFKNVSASDTGTRYCAVATCEEISSGNKSELDTEETQERILWLLQR